MPQEEASEQNATEQGPFKRYAAIDIGTVTCRLLIAECNGALVHPLVQRAVITNLGEDVDATHMLKPSAMERVFRTVEDYLNIISEFDKASKECGSVRANTASSLGAASEHVVNGNNIIAAAEHAVGNSDTPSPSPSCHDVTRVIALATSAARDAHNASVFIEGLAQRGVSLSIIPGEKEAALSFLGASADFAGHPIIVTDIGGGSTEIIAGIAGQTPLFAHSFDIGCRRITERILTDDPLDATQVEKARQWIRGQFGPYFQKMSEAGFSAEHVVSVAGTATSIVSMIKRMEVYDSALVHGSSVNKDELDQLFCELSHMTLEQRMHRVGLQPQRASVICGGLIIQQEVLRAAQAHSFIASESDILQGVTLTTAREATHQSN